MSFNGPAAEAGTAWPAAIAAAAAVIARNRWVRGKRNIIVAP
jgi:hypothetical protein